MLRIFALCILLFFSSCTTKDEPFNFSIDGILYDKENPEAVISGEILKIGDKVDGAEITEIAEDYVKFKYNDEIFIKKLVVTREDILKSEKQAKARAQSRKKEWLDKRRK